MADFDADAYDQQVAEAESGGDSAARNPASTAAGKYQINDPTYQGVVEAHPEIMDITDPGSRYAAVMKNLTTDNQAGLARAGLPTDAAATYAAHRWGLPVAMQILKADAATPISSLISSDVARANPKDAALTAGQWRDQNAANFGGGKMDNTDVNPLPAPTIPDPNAPPTTPDPSTAPLAAPLAPGGDLGSAYTNSINNAIALMEQNRGLIGKYTAAQPGQVDALKALAASYQQQAKPNLLDTLGSALLSYNAARTASDPGRYATMGGIATHSLPDVAGQMAGIKGQQDTLASFLAQRQALAKAQMDAGTQALAMQQGQAKDALGLQTGLNTAEAQMNLSRPAALAAMMKTQSEQMAAADTALKSRVGNDTTRATIMSGIPANVILMGGAPLLAALNNGYATAQAKGLPMNPQSPEASTNTAGAPVVFDKANPAQPVQVPGIGVPAGAGRPAPAAAPVATSSVAPGVPGAGTSVAAPSGLPAPPAMPAPPAQPKAITLGGRPGVASGTALGGKFDTTGAAIDDAAKAVDKLVGVDQLKSSQTELTNTQAIDASLQKLKQAHASLYGNERKTEIGALLAQIPGLDPDILSNQERSRLQQFSNQLSLPAVKEDIPAGSRMTNLDFEKFSELLDVGGGHLSTDNAILFNQFHRAMAQRQVDMAKDWQTAVKNGESTSTFNDWAKDWQIARNAQEFTNHTGLGVPSLAPYTAPRVANDADYQALPPGSSYRIDGDPTPLVKPRAE